MTATPESEDRVLRAIVEGVEAETGEEFILAVLRQTNWRVDGPRGAARILNLHPSTLRSRMQKLGIRRSGHELS